jgi:uncharacterized protein (UPF0264 family)
MKLLVSVRSAAEASTALGAGADIIDAKEPSLGSLGPVSSAVLSKIFDRVPERCSLSVALGDVATSGEVRQRISAVPLRRTAFLKLGFAGVRDSETLSRLLDTARTAAASIASSRIVAVCYADAALAGSADPYAVCQAAAQAGVAGILFDTYSKNEGDLLSWIPLVELTGLVARARGLGLFTAVAGRLSVRHLNVVRNARPDIVGFRGALCVGGREGRLSGRRVRLVQRALAGSGFVQEVIQA